MRSGLGKATRAGAISNESIGILGVGRFATALASVIATEHKAAALFTTDASIRSEINGNHRNPARLPGVSLAKRVAATSDPAELCSLSKLIVIAVPSPRVEQELSRIKAHLTPDHVLIHAVGGLVGGQRRVSQVIEEITGSTRIVALAGPALPRDLSARRSCALVAASKYPELVDRLRESIEVPRVLRIYKSTDLLGVELASAISSALTVVMGIADGFGVGDGPRTVLLTRALAEGARIGSANGAKERTFYGMAGLGNLLVRASPARGVHSVDYEMGLAIGREDERPFPSTEGTRSLAMVARLAELVDIGAPICRVSDRVVRGEIDVARASDQLANVEIDLE